MNMNWNWVFTATITGLVLYYLWNIYGENWMKNYNKMTVEPFTISDLNLAKNILTYVQAPGSTYTGYAQFLTANKNTSANLATIDTYSGFINKGSSLTVSDILEQF